MSRKVSNRTSQETTQFRGKSTRDSKKSKKSNIWNALKMGFHDVKLVSKKQIDLVPEFIVEEKRTTTTSKLEVGISTILGCRGGECEDEHYHHTLELERTGPMDIIGVFDGHGGKRVATFLKTDGYPILVEHLTSKVSNADDKDGIIEALGETQRDWLNNCPLTGGSTVILSIFVRATNMTYNLCIGDGRFYYFNENDGELISEDIETYDYATQETEIYIGNACNIIHQINGKVLQLDGIEVSDWQELNCQKLTPIVFDKYKFDTDDERKLNWNEWKKWNMDPMANNSGRLKFPKSIQNAYRMDLLQPSRSIGIDEKGIKMGTLYMIKLDQTINVMGAFCCDGIDDNQATNQDTFGRFAVNFTEANENFFDNHLGVKHMKSLEYDQFAKKYPQPSKYSEIKEKIAWLRKSMEESNPLSFLDNDWKNGIIDSDEFFQKNSLDANDCLSIAERMSKYVEGRMSADNVTVAITRYMV